MGFVKPTSYAALWKAKVKSREIRMFYALLGELTAKGILTALI